MAATSDNPALRSFLQTIPLFALMEEADMLDLLRLLRPVTLEPGQVLFHQGEPGKALWVLGPGVEVSVSAHGRDGGKPAVVAYARGGETLGELALIDDGSRSGTALVVQGGQAHQIDAVDFHSLRQSYSPSAFKILRRLCLDLCTKLRATSDRIVPSAPRTVSTPVLPVVSRATEKDVEAFAPLARLPKVVKLALSQKLTVIQLENVQPIFAEGDAADAAYLIVEGEVTVGRNGKTLASLGPGSMLGLVSVIDKGRRSASCVTAGAARLLRLGRADFDALFTSGNRFAFDLVDLVTRQLVAHLRASNELIPRPGQIQARFTPVPAINEVDFLAEAEILPLELDITIDVTT